MIFTPYRMNFTQRVWSFPGDIKFHCPNAMPSPILVFPRYSSLRSCFFRSASARETSYGHGKCAEEAAFGVQVTRCDSEPTFDAIMPRLLPTPGPIISLKLNHRGSKPNLIRFLNTCMNRWILCL